MIQQVLKIAMLALSLFTLGCKSDGKSSEPDPLVLPPNSEDMGKESDTPAEPTGSNTIPTPGTEEAPEPADKVSDKASCESDGNKIWLNEACEELSQVFSSLILPENSPALGATDASACRAAFRIGKGQASTFVNATSLEDLNEPGKIRDSWPETPKNVTAYCTNGGFFVGRVEGFKNKFLTASTQAAVYVKCRNLAIQQVRRQPFQFIRLSTREAPALFLWPYGSNPGLSWSSILDSEKYSGLDAVVCGQAVADIWQGIINLNP